MSSASIAPTNYTNDSEPVPVLPLYKHPKPKGLSRNPFSKPPFPFFRLPPELRLMVYKILLRKVSTWTNFAGFPIIALLNTSRLVRNEAFSCIRKIEINFTHNDTEARLRAFLRVWDKYRGPGRRGDVKLLVKCSAQNWQAWELMTTRWVTWAARGGCELEFMHEVRRARCWENLKVEMAKWIGSALGLMIIVGLVLTVCLVKS